MKEKQVKMAEPPELEDLIVDSVSCPSTVSSSFARIMIFLLRETNNKFKSDGELPGLTGLTFPRIHVNVEGNG